MHLQLELTEDENDDPRVRYRLRYIYHFIKSGTKSERYHPTR